MLRYLRITFAILLAVLIVLVTWALIPSSLFLSPIGGPAAWKYDGQTGKVTLQRYVSLASGVTARWTTELWTDDGFECSASGVSFYQSHETSPTGEVVPVTEVTYPISPELIPCLLGDKPVLGTVSWSVLAGGILPLRPVRAFVRYDPNEARSGNPRMGLQYRHREVFTTENVNELRTD